MIRILLLLIIPFWGVSQDAEIIVYKGTAYTYLLDEDSGKKYVAFSLFDELFERIQKLEKQIGISDLRDRIIKDLKRPKAVSTIYNQYRKSELIEFALEEEIVTEKQSEKIFKRPLIAKLLNWARDNKILNQRKFTKQVKLLEELSLQNN